ncbi:MAG: YopX family protein [Nanoarchaeota archaeon]
MKREIKFKAFDRRHNLIREIYTIDYRNKGFLMIEMAGLNGEIHEWGNTIDHVDLIEYTGMKDNKKNEVFEGHILQNIKDKVLFDWLVCFKDGCFGCINIGIDGYLGDFWPVDSTYFFDDREIIGHMYTHPELLKGHN